MRIGSEKIYVLHGGRKRAKCLDGVEAEKNALFAQKFSDGDVIEPVAADEMVGGERDEARIFIHLPHHINGADDAEAARVEQPDFDALLREREPRINIGGIIVVINQDVITFAKF